MDEEILVVLVSLLIFLAFQWLIYAILNRSLSARVDALGSRLDGMHQRLDNMSRDFNVRTDNVNQRLDTLMGRPILVQPGSEAETIPPPVSHEE